MSTPSQLTVAATPFDCQDVIKKIGGPDIFRYVAELYLKEHQKMVGNIEEALKKQDYASLVNHTHKLCGASLNFGDNQVARTCQQMEALANKRETEALNEFHDYLLIAIEKLNHELSQALEKIQIPSSE